MASMCKHVRSFAKAKCGDIAQLKLNSFVCNRRAGVLPAILASIVHKNKNLLSLLLSDCDDDFKTIKLYNPLRGTFG